MTDFEVNELAASVENISSILVLNRNSFQVDITMQDANKSSIIIRFAHIFTHILPRAGGDYHINERTKQFHVYHSSKGYMDCVQQREIAFRLRFLFRWNQPSHKDSSNLS